MSPRPSKTSREQIVCAAIGVLDAGKELSMRALAASMRVDPMTLYHHLPNKDALLDAVLDHVWGEVAVNPPVPGSGWQGVIIELADGLRAVLLAHPRLAGLVASRPAITPTLLASIDRVLGWLYQEGLAAAEALRILDCVIGYVIGKVQQEVRPPELGAQLFEEGLSVAEHTHPHLAEALSDGYDWAPDAEFRMGLEALVRGWAVGG
ncbi:hypothetical protein HMPREF1531_01017 [Propionibacterium sp. oral taxon 192 str. F0372]|uniref:TetR/AcrR family transcriptional regulator C-terminal domain-containing protein n=1 Tax=Propionibacterium sp. oral taxon 192 TaxID=671222 RepID=UPI00035289DD|nr:TetR/AcrR family transcriptional regulator C-terminal domain-containing protein [Propionibacterium sp. oral taxon 192]EPH05588.1 hypothetical protein HMPREF1531_01017 [Propionibacterium sp. oral taxon 192 str. F0372]